MWHEANNLWHFWAQEWGNLLPGLVDSTDASHFLTQLQQLQDSWNSISPDFFGWFSKNEADLMCSSMITSVRTSAGLGNPPKSFTTNNNESLNHLLKQKADYKWNEWPSFNKLQDLCEQQQHECAKAVFGEGEFELVDELQAPGSPSLNVDWNVSRATKTVGWQSK